MATSAQVESVTLSEDHDIVDVILPNGKTLYVYGNGEVSIEDDESPWSEVSVNLVTKLEKATKRARKLNRV